MKFKIMFLLFLGITTSIYSQNTKKPVAAKKTTVTAKKPNAAALEGIFAEIETTKGKIVVQLEYQKTPVTVANFISLAEGKNTFVTDEKLKGKPFYDGLKFHRVIKDFMIQGGDPAGNGSGGPGYAFKDEFTDLKHDKGGILSMANSGPTTNGSQFFITHKETSWLNGKHTVFGHVTSGMEVVNAITQDDAINKVTIVRKGAVAKKFDAPKVFADYFGNKAEDQKKQAAIDAENRAKQAIIDAEAKRVYDEKSAPIKAKKLAYLNGIKATATKSDTGLEYKIIQKGTGKKPVGGTNIYVYYAGYLEDGSLFDSNYEEVNKTYGKFDQNRASQNGYQPFPFQYGKKDGLIPGFLEGLNLMSFGDKAVIFIPAKLGYGERGAGGVIPPNANIIFEIEMLEAMPSSPTK
ncbi:peptidylprolyl isomerase [Flavobacterium sp.]|uniref:peptidylprolyl isomerase n=1 Tax=Flavobacterium sp. TaxID=239 RepID=UPI002B4AE56F|nr:peptidylprolyl isomerase [Flavobacterium sp.]HLF50963.1 peptidylprolyl isomerase [Flavobacterium sp.]